MTEDKKFPHAAAGFLYDSSTKSVLLHLRDGNTKVNPNKWAFFTGLCEGDETPKQAFCREIKEEIGLSIEEDEAQLLYEYLNEEMKTYRYIFFIARFVPLAELKLGEGAGFDWVPLDKVSTLDLTEKTEKDLKYFSEYLKNNQ